MARAIEMRCNLWACAVMSSFDATAMVADTLFNHITGLANVHLFTFGTHDTVDDPC